MLVLALVLTVAFMNGEALGLKAEGRKLGYEDRLFDSSKVHTIDIVMEDWDSFIQTCENEEYSLCSVVIDGEAHKSIGIRAKGNTSLSTVSQMDSDRYSFKIEFDQYDSTKSYHGLDKLSLNNLIQDNTFMKDYLVYQLMNKFGASAPLCSFAYITVNGEDWGLYLAVEGVEESFLQRNYGSDYGELYKPDSMSFGGGRGNGREFNMEDFDFSAIEEQRTELSQQNGAVPQFPNFGGERPNGEMADMFGGEMPQMPSEGEFGGFNGEVPQMPENFNPFSGDNGGGRGGFGGMGSSDVKLQYIDDDPDSYSNIFGSAKTDVTEADKARLISSLKTLSSGENIENAVDIEQVIRYFVVHNFVVNGDSYTGSMIHNYYLYEKDGLLSMLPWDYNLAYGTFQGSSASDAVNNPIDTPVSGGSMADRPMINWIFQSEEYTALYHQYFEEFISSCFDGGWFEGLVRSTVDLISPYVEKDPTKFCTYEEFELGASTIKNFCLLRAQSVKGQLSGSIPSTEEGRKADGAALVDASTITISDMGTMSMGGRGGRENFGGKNDRRGENASPSQEEEGSQPVEENAPAPVKPESIMNPPDAPNIGGEAMPAMAQQNGATQSFENPTKPAQGEAQQSIGNSGQTMVTVSVGVLVLGLIFAAAFKRRKI